jgi:RNA polymerase sigma factor (sigma-70 family)
MRNDVPINYCWQAFVLNESRDAYYELYRHYYAYLSYIGLKKGFSTEVVKDTINDVFLYLWEKRRSLQHIHHPHNYLLTFFHRSIINGMRPANVLIEDINEECKDEYEGFAEPSFEQDLLDKESQERLSALVNRHLNYLPRQQREIMYQKFYLGLSYAEIASANKISINTVYNPVYAAMQKLRTSIPTSAVASLISLFAVLHLFFS